MNTSIQPILDLLTDAERKRDAALDRAERAKAEANKHAADADAYRRVLDAIGAKGEIDTTSSETPTHTERKPRKPRPPSKKWLDIYTALYLGADAPYDYQAIIDAASSAGHEITDGGMRTQMMNAVNSGLFKRVDAGKFEFTESGLQAIDAEPKRNEPPEGGSETEEAATSSDPGVMPGMFTSAPLHADPAPHGGREGGD